MKFYKKLFSWFKLTPKNTIMWVRVPMTCINRNEKDDVIISTINHLEQNIKIKQI